MTSETKVNFMNQLGGNSTYGILEMQLHELAVQVCVVRVQMNAHVSLTVRHSPSQNYITLEPLSNEYD